MAPAEHLKALVFLILRFRYVCGCDSGSVLRSHVSPPRSAAHATGEIDVEKQCPVHT